MPPAKAPILDLETKRRRLSRTMTHSRSGSANPTDWSTSRGRQKSLDNLASITSLAPVIGDVTGLAADVNSLIDPGERTLTKIIAAGVGALPFVPSPRAAKQALKIFETPEDVANISAKEADEILNNRKTAVYDKVNDALYTAPSTQPHNESAMKMVRKRYEELGLDPNDTDPALEMQMMFHGTTYGVESKGKVFSREAQAALEQKRSGGFAPFSGMAGETKTTPLGETVSQKQWERWRTANLEKTDPKLWGVIGNAELPVEQRVQAYIEMMNDVGKANAKKFLNFLPDDEGSLMLMVEADRL